jgi:DNA processing protein
MDTHTKPTTQEAKYYNAINLLPEFGPIRFTKLRNGFANMEQAWKADTQELLACGLEERVVARFIAHRTGIDPDAEIARLAGEGIQVVLDSDPTYPSRLREIFHAPPILYVRGELPDPDAVIVAVVGTRKMTSYGKQVTEEFARALAARGVTIVSGLAYGIDTAAHNAALGASGKTIAVLPTCVDHEGVYPQANRLLAEQIAMHGTLLSEFPLGTLALKQNFPARNRIISGLALGTLVVEADEESGALITAKWALEQNREVFAVPGNIHQAMSRGTNALIKQGARLVATVEDILDALNIEQVLVQAETKSVIADTPEEAKLLDLLGREAMHVDDLVQASGLPASLVNSSLTMMEMKGKVRNVGSQEYVIAR